MKKIMVVLTAVVLVASLCVPVFAAKGDFVPSVEMKPGPVIVDQEVDGVPGVAVIITQDGKEIIVPEGALIITPFSKKADASDKTRKELEDAFDKIANAATLEDLLDGLQDILDSIANGTDVADLVVTDLFHVDLTGDYADYMKDGAKLRIKLKSDDDLIALLQQNGDAWKAIYGDLFVDNGDGTYTLTIDKLGVYAMLRDAVGASVDYDDPAQSSPQTGDMLWVLMTIPAALAIGGVFCLVMSKKQKA